MPNDDRTSGPSEAPERTEQLAKLQSRRLASKHNTNLERPPPILPEAWRDKILRINIPHVQPRTAIYTVGRWLKEDDCRISSGEAVVELQGIPQNAISGRQIEGPRAIRLDAPADGVLWLDETVDSHTNLKVGDTIAVIYRWHPGEPGPFNRAYLHNIDLSELFPRAKRDETSVPPERPSSSLITDTPSSPVRLPPKEVRATLAEPSTNKHGIFISYRRSDQAAFAGRLYDHLVNAFDKSTIFMDVDSIDLGLDFVDVVNEALSKCQVLIVVIGRDWLTTSDELGVRRLDNPDDYVRLEVETALQRGLRVIPVLVDGAPMPRSTELPHSVASLARRNGRVVSNARFGSDTIGLINTLRWILEN